MNDPARPGSDPKSEYESGQPEIKALLFDVFGTVVDWRGSIAREMAEFATGRGLPERDWDAFARDWRRLYQPAMERVRSGELGWTRLDVLHRMNLDRIAADYGLDGLSEAEMDHVNRVWHRLRPWPDVVAGLNRLRPRFVLAPVSNGNIALMVNLARHAGLPWDTVLGAEVARGYKPQPHVYTHAAEALGLAPGQCMMVAAHNDDLHAAAACGLRTAFVPRPEEYGPGQTKDLEAEPGHDRVAADFGDLAAQLGC